VISRELKSLFYVALRLPMRWNASLYKSFRAPRSGEVKVHLGPGLKNYVDGWINVDANLLTARIDVWADLTNPLPFRDATVDVFYSHHVIEHLSDQAIASLFREMHRCLKPSGVIRVGGPDGDTAIRKFIEGDKTWFGDWPDKRSSIGGRFANFIFCRGEHVTMLSRSYLEEMAAESHFANVAFCAPAMQTNHPTLIGSEILERESEPTPDAPHTLIMEAQKACA
jgi:predicted SAM-dependent methyltransferase